MSLKGINKKKWEDLLYFQLSSLGINLTREYKAIAGRKFSFDFAIEELMILIEVQGGTWGEEKQGHSTGAGIKRDCEKLNLAQLAGWKVLHFTSDMVRDGDAFIMVEKFTKLVP